MLLAACHHAEPPPAPAPRVDGERIVFPAGSRYADVLASVPAVAAESHTLRVPGRLAWDDTRSARVFAAMAGQVAAIEAQPGDAVEAGQTLALIASPDYGEAQAEHAKARADLRQAEQQRRRSRDLQQAGVIATKDLEEAETAWAHAQAEATRTAARSRQYGGGAAVDQRLPLRAPIAGVVVERQIQPGQEVAPEQAQGDAAALFTLSDPTQLWLWLDLPESQATRVRAGQIARFSADAGRSFDEATVEHVADFVDAQTRSVRVRAALANPERRLKAGLFVTAELALPGEGALEVPAAAALLVDDRRVVFVDEGGGRYRRQSVEGEEVAGARVQVRSDLAAGERVVVAGALYLQQLLATQVVQ